MNKLIIQSLTRVCFPKGTQRKAKINRLIRQSLTRVCSPKMEKGFDFGEVSLVKVNDKGKNHLPLRVSVLKKRYENRK